MISNFSRMLAVVGDLVLRAPRSYLSSGRARDYYGISIEETKFSEDVLAWLIAELDQADVAEDDERLERNAIGVDLFDLYISLVTKPRVVFRAARRTNMLIRHVDENCGERFRFRSPTLPIRTAEGSRMVCSFESLCCSW